MRRINPNGFGRRYGRLDRKMADRKIENGSGLLHFSVCHFSVRHFPVWLVSAAETTTQAIRENPRLLLC
jgi:hypothetical protein